MVNKSIIVGRLTAKPTFDKSSGGTAYSRFTIAANRPTNDSQADFIPCVAFRKTAELADQYLDKGSLVAIEGRINSSNYTNKDGKNVSRIEVVVDRLTFLESRNARRGNSSNEGSSNYNNSSYNNNSSSNDTYNSNNNNNTSQQSTNDDFDDLDFVFE